MTATRRSAIAKALLVVTASSSLAALIHLGVLLPWLGPPAPVLVVALSVVASAAYGGLWAGLLATAIGAVIAASGLGLGVSRLSATPDEFARLSLLITGCVIAALLAAALRKARKRSESARLAIAREMADRQLAQQRLMASEARFRELVESLPDIVFVADALGIPRHTNRRWFEFSGQTEQQPEQEHWIERVHGTDRERVLAEWTLAVNTQIPLEARCRLRGQDGSYRWFLVRARPVHGVADEPIQWFGVATDIDAQMRAEAALRDREEQLRLALESTGLGVFEFEFWTRRIVWSDRCRAIWGFDTGEPLTIRKIRDALHPDDRRKIARALSGVRDPDGSAEFAFEFRVLRPDGQQRWVAARGCAFFVSTADGDRAIRCIGTMLDFTERRASEELLRRSEQRLREADRRKDEFLAILAHELRNPLAPMRNALQLLEASAARPETSRYARSVLDRQLTQMVRLIDDLLDVARITSGKLALRRSTVSLSSLAQSAVETARPLIRERHHELRVHLPQSPVEVNCDEARISQVLSNLLNNAARYTPIGGFVELTARANESEIVFEVRDNGVGISPEALDSIFEMFAQGGVTPAAGHSGLGVGLPLSRSLIALHDGRLEAASGGHGHGTMFTVRLPRGAQPILSVPAPATGHTIDAVRSRKILVVDDNRDAADSLGELLRIAGHETRVCHDGHHALVMAEAFRPDVVLLDIGMPRIDGHEVTRRLRSQPWGRHMQIVALSGFGRPDDRQRSVDAGCDQHLTKPVSDGDLRRAISGGPPSKSPAVTPREAGNAAVPAR
jgi:PAS domain S-box-containing protein